MNKQIEKFRLYDTPTQHIVDGSTSWATLDSGDYPYHGKLYDWGDLMENRESIFIKNQGAVAGLLYFGNYSIIDEEDNCTLKYNLTNTRWELTLPVTAGVHFQIINAGALRTALNSATPGVSSSPVILYTTHLTYFKNIEVIMSSVGGDLPVLLSSDASTAVYSVVPVSETGLDKTGKITKIRIKLYDSPTPVDASALELPVAESISLDLTSSVAVMMKTSTAFYTLQVK